MCRVDGTSHSENFEEKIEQGPSSPRTSVG